MIVHVVTLVVSPAHKAIHPKKTIINPIPNRYYF